MLQPIIEVSHLTKSFRIRDPKSPRVGFIRSVIAPPMTTKQAVLDVTFTIGKGELVGFIGPNGAGKTTTLKMLTGLLYPTSGRVSVMGYEPFLRSHEFLKSITLVMGQKQQLWWELPVIDSFYLHKEIYEIPREQFDKTLTEFTELFDLSEILTEPPRNLSLGQRMKCELAVSLLHKPKVLFLDEPTIGLDVMMQQHVRNFIATYNKEFGATVLLTSHYMDDVKELCKRVIVINEGKLIFDGKLDTLSQTYADYKILSLVFREAVSMDLLSQYGAIQGYDDVSVSIHVPTKKVGQVAAHILKHFPVEDITIQEPIIEDIIRNVFKASSATFTPT